MCGSGRGCGACTLARQRVGVEANMKRLRNSQSKDGKNNLKVDP